MKLENESKIKTNLKKEGVGVNVRMDKELKKEFMDMLEETERVFSKWVRNAMRKELNDYKNKQKK